MLITHINRFYLETKLYCFLKKSNSNTHIIFHRAETDIPSSPNAFLKTCKIGNGKAQDIRLQSPVSVKHNPYVS